MKKIIRIVVILLLASSFLYANGTQDSDTAVSADEPMKVTLNSYAVGPVDEDAWVIEYFGEKVGLDIEFIYLESNKAEELLNLRFAAGEEPDTFLVGGSYAKLGSWVDQGLLAEIPRDMLNANAPDIVQAMNEVDGWDEASLNGKMYALIEIRGHDLFSSPVIWRGDWLKNVGISSIPKTLDEAEKALYAFRNDDPDGNGIKDTYGLSASGMNPVYGAFGYLPNNWAEKDGKLVYGGVQPEMKQALEVLARWYKDEVIDPEWVTGENTGGYWALNHMFINGRIGFANSAVYYHWMPEKEGRNTVFANAKEVPLVNPDAEITFGIPFTGPDGKAGVWKATPINPRMVFSSRLENEPEKLARLLQLYNEVGKNKLNFHTAQNGQQGVHWDYNENGKPQRIEPWTDMAELTKIGGNVALYATVLPDVWWSQFPGYQEWCKENVDYDTYYENALLAPLPSGAKYQAELDKFREEAYISIITGTEPLDYFDTFAAEWMKLGGEQLTKEANEWYSSR